MNSYNLKLNSAYDQHYLDQNFSKVAPILKKYQIDPAPFKMKLNVFVNSRIDTIKHQLIQLANEEPKLSSEIDTVQWKLDTLKTKIPALTFQCPLWFYQLEDGVKSVEHAQRYLKWGIIGHYYKWLLYFIPFLSLLFWASLYARLNLLVAGVYLLSCIFFAAYFLISEEHFDFNKIGIACQSISLFVLIVHAFQRKNTWLSDFSCQITLALLFLFFLSGLLCDNHFFLQQEMKYTLPNWALYSSQIIGLLSLLIVVHLRTLPRK